MDPKKKKKIKAFCQPNLFTGVPTITHTSADISDTHITTYTKSYLTLRRQIFIVFSMNNRSVVRLLCSESISGHFQCQYFCFLFIYVQVVYGGWRLLLNRILQAPLPQLFVAQYYLLHSIRDHYFKDKTKSIHLQSSLYFLLLSL